MFLFVIVVVVVLYAHSSPTGFSILVKNETKINKMKKIKTALTKSRNFLNHFNDTTTTQQQLQFRK